MHGDSTSCDDTEFPDDAMWRADEWVSWSSRPLGALVVMGESGRVDANHVVAAWKLGLRDDGYVPAHAALDRSEVEALGAAFPPAASGSTSHIELDDTTPHIEQWRGLVRRGDVAAFLAECLGEFSVHLHGREPGSGAGAQGLHADRPPGRTHDIDAVTLIWMLDDFTVGNGATRVVPRSHRGAAAVPRHLAPPDVRHPDEIVVCGEAGDLLILDAHLWHSGRRNRDGARRRAVQMMATRTSLVVAGTGTAER